MRKGNTKEAEAVAKKYILDKFHSIFDGDVISDVVERYKDHEKTGCQYTFVQDFIICGTSYDEMNKVLSEIYDYPIEKAADFSLEETIEKFSSYMQRITEKMVREYEMTTAEEIASCRINGTDGKTYELSTEPLAFDGDYVTGVLVATDVNDSDNKKTVGFKCKVEFQDDDRVTVPSYEVEPDTIFFANAKNLRVIEYSIVTQSEYFAEDIEYGYEDEENEENKEILVEVVRKYKEENNKEENTTKKPLADVKKTVAKMKAAIKERLIADFLPSKKKSLSDVKKSVAGKKNSIEHTETKTKDNGR